MEKIGSILGVSSTHEIIINQQDGHIVLLTYRKYSTSSDDPLMNNDLKPIPYDIRNIDGTVVDLIDQKQIVCDRIFSDRVVASEKTFKISKESKDPDIEDLIQSLDINDQLIIKDNWKIYKLVEGTTVRLFKWKGTVYFSTRHSFQAYQSKNGGISLIDEWTRLGGPNPESFFPSDQESHPYAYIFKVCANSRIVACLHQEEFIYLQEVQKITETDQLPLSTAFAKAKETFKLDYDQIRSWLFPKDQKDERLSSGEAIYIERGPDEDTLIIESSAYHFRWRIRGSDPYPLYRRYIIILSEYDIIKEEKINIDLPSWIRTTPKSKRDAMFLMITPDVFKDELKTYIQSINSDMEGVNNWLKKINQQLQSHQLLWSDLTSDIQEILATMRRRKIKDFREIYWPGTKIYRMIKHMKRTEIFEKKGEIYRPIMTK